MTDPIARPGNDDEGIANATDEVVDTWQRSSEGKDPSAGTEDFERMRDGFGGATGSGSSSDGGSYSDAQTREEQLSHADPAAPGATASRRATSESGPDA